MNILALGNALKDTYVEANPEILKKYHLEEEYITELEDWQMTLFTDIEK